MVNRERGWRERVHPDCRAFVETVEDLLARRRAELTRGEAAVPAWQADPWGPRSWHRTELEDVVYSSYKQMRQGRITRPPRRETVMEVAGYLNCTLAERNRLLLAAHAAPVSPYLTGESLAELVPVAIGVAQQLSIPAMVINRDWQIHYQNEHILASFAISPIQLAALRPDQRNVLHLLFDPALPLYPNLIVYRESWERMARQTIYAFKLANLLCQHEPWYGALVGGLMRLPAFAQHWGTVQIDASFDGDPSAILRSPAVTVDVALALPQPGGEQARLRPLVISVGYFQFDFPLVLAFLPIDAPAPQPIVMAGSA
jgi:hypothetical protein